MFRRFSVNFAIFSILLDAVLMLAGLLVADLLRWRFNNLSFVQYLAPSVRVPIALYAIFPVVWISVLFIFSIYDGRRSLRIADELASLTLGTMLGTISMAGVLYLSFRNVSRFLFLFYVVLVYFSMLGWRILLRILSYKFNIFKIQSRRVLVLGAGTVGQQIAQQIKQMPYLGLSTVGFLDDDPSKREKVPGILGSLDDVRTVIQQHDVDDVVIALPRSAYSRMNQVVGELHDLPVKVWVIPDYFSLTLHQATVHEFAGIPMLDLRAPALSEYQRLFKRAFDLLIILSSLIFSIPVMGIIALAIRLSDGGPAFYRPKRVGENGRLFTMWKFRTMVVNADQLRYLVDDKDDQGRLVFKKVPNDPRITPIGKFLRRTSLDELPQLYNVLKGEMSLVGPRPEMPELVEKYELWQRKRFAIPQGMTGWWQINGRSDKPMHLHTEEDLYYVQHYSLWLDLQILVKTFWAALNGKGAY